MKKIFTIISIVGVSLMMSSCLLDWIKKPDQTTPKLYHSIEYRFIDNVDYFKADLLSCYGVKDSEDPTIGTIHAKVKITGNLTTNPRLRFGSIPGFRNPYILSNAGEFDATSFVEEMELGKDETLILNLEFPNVPSNLIKISRIYVDVSINDIRFYNFIIYQIPYLPKHDRIEWR